MSWVVIFTIFLALALFCYIVWTVIGDTDGR